jgi:hypothetical protein
MEGQDLKHELSDAELIDNIDETKEKGEKEKSVKFKEVVLEGINADDPFDFYEEDGTCKKIKHNDILASNISFENTLELMDRLEEQTEHRGINLSLVGILESGRIITMRTTRASHSKIEQIRKSFDQKM